MYKKTWCTCKAVVLLIKPIAFFDAQSLKKQAKQTGVSCWFTLCFAGGVFCVTSFGVCTPPKHQETTKQTKRNDNKNQEPCKSESFASRYFFLFPSIRSPVLGYQVENASPNHFDPGLPRNLKVANRKVLKKIEDFVSILWTLYEVDVSFVHELLVTARDKQRSYN